MDAPEAQLAWLRLLRTPGLGPAAGLRLLAQWPDPLSIIGASASQWQSAGVDRALHAACREVPEAELQTDVQWLSQPDCALITRDDPRYPARLREQPRSPLALFTKGDPDLLLRPQLAIVGARSATPQGLENARAFAAELTRYGLVVSSGLALGVDAAAHEGALGAGGLTLAVCGTGLDRVYPARHRDLAHRISAEGLLVSEFVPGTPALAEHFPRRNRIISALSLGVLVVEAARQSGSLITAKLAADQGRELFAIPGSIHNPMARGCHQLIREGAKLVETAADILEELAPLLGDLSVTATVPSTAPPDSVGPALSPDVQALARALDDAPVSVDQLAQRLGWPAQRVNSVLLEAELAGQADRLNDGRYMRGVSGGA